jgi:tetratricopeptide (TPR) repeat protein
MVAPMNVPSLDAMRAAVESDPENARMRYLFGAELAQQGHYAPAAVEMHKALELEPTLHYARLQLALLHLTLSQPAEAVQALAPLEALDDSAALKFFKRGIEALLRDDVVLSIENLERGIGLNTENVPLNNDMNRLLQRLRAPVEAPAQPEKPVEAVRTDFSLYVDPTDTKH